MGSKYRINIVYGGMLKYKLITVIVYEIILAKKSISTSYFRLYKIGEIK